jgi:dipeptidyl-peptidase-4
MLLKIKLLLLTAALVLSAQLQAQKKQFTMAEATNGLVTTLALQNIKQPGWEPGTDRLWQVVKTAEGDAWVKTAFPSGKQDTVLTLKQLNHTIGHDLKSMPNLTWIDREYTYFVNDGHVYMGVLTANGFTWADKAKLPANAENIAVSKSRTIAYTVDNNLWFADQNGNTFAVTKEKDPNIICGKTVHREEFGIDRGIFFSPRGKYLAYYRMDQTMVADYPIIDWSVIPAKNHNIKYPMAGGTSHQVTLCVYNPNSGETVTMQTGEPKDQYLTCVTWSPDEKYIFIALLNREQNHLWLNQYDAETGRKIKTLFEESDKKYVHPQHPLTFLPGSNDEFVWWSQKDGYMHLYLYNTNGKELKELTKGDWVVNDLLGFNSVAHQVLFTSSKESPLEKHAYAVDWKTGKMDRIDQQPGMHNVMASEDGKYILDIYSSENVPKKIIVRSTESSYSKLLVDAPNTLRDYDRPEIKDIHIKAADGKTTLYGKLILPTHFDKTKKYPVIVYLYNGPNVQLIHNSFPASGNLWYEYMAQHGYIVFTMDGRGSSNRGLAFEQVTFRHLGEVEMDDQLRGVAYLKSLPYVDSNRLGLHGWSFGGFMTTSLMLHHPGVFKVAVAGGPVMDWKMYEVMYTERYMDRPQDNPEGYEEANLQDKVKNLKGKLLLIHGTNDDVVVWQHSIDFIKNCVDEGVQLDYFVYPGHPHNVRGKDRVHLMEKITEYFEQNL